MESTWFFSSGERVEGPLTWDGLVSAVRHRRLTDEGDVWISGLRHWIPATSVPGLHAPIAVASTEQAHAPGTLLEPPPHDARAHASARAQAARLAGAHRATTRAAAPASRMQRLGATVVDLAAAVLCTSGLAAVLYNVVGWMTHDRELVEVPILLGVVLFPFGIVIACAWLEARRGATVGKQILELAVVATDGGPLRLGRALVRNVLKFVPVLLLGVLGPWVLIDAPSGIAVLVMMYGLILLSLPVLAWALVAPPGRTLHDRIARTSVRHMEDA